jgi:hypothetical protein
MVEKNGFICKYKKEGILVYELISN